MPTNFQESLSSVVVFGITLLAISESNDPEIIDSTSDMMKIANGYFNAGFPALFSLIDARGDDTALDTLCDEIEDFVDAS